MKRVFTVLKIFRSFVLLGVIKTSYITDFNDLVIRSEIGRVHTINSKQTYAVEFLVPNLTELALELNKLLGIVFNIRRVFSNICCHGAKFRHPAQNISSYLKSTILNLSAKADATKVYHINPQAMPRKDLYLLLNQILSQSLEVLNYRKYANLYGGSNSAPGKDGQTDA